MGRERRLHILFFCFFFCFSCFVEVNNQEVKKLTLQVERKALYSDPFAPFYEPFEQSKKRLSKSQAAHVVKVRAGTPAVVFDLMIDTGYSMTAVPVDGCFCLNCTSTSCATNLLQSGQPIACASKQCSRQQCSTATPSECGFWTTFPEGPNLQGSLVETLVGLGDWNLTSIIGGIEQQSSDWNNRAAGVLSLTSVSSQQVCFPNCVDSFIDVLVRSENISNVVTLSLSNSTGKVTIGGLDDDIKSNISYVDVHSESLYGFLVNYLSFGDEHMEVRKVAYIQSAASKNFVSHSLFDDIENFFKDNHEELPGVTSDPDIFSGHCLEAAEMMQYPPLSFVLDKVIVTVNPVHYFVPITLQNHTLYCFGFLKWDDSDREDLELGDPFLRGVRSCLTELKERSDLE
eukprot:TRINITY_DN1503_c0_g1_i4.p1 TRINITY_DN1503_c0_g1~~TRINITY_DN1503_c0_g1_i4.p1  ORF type:complete len:401 (-),score=66.70 TRINITY_DN1503_c0_g1_i4:76-1278(-)